MASDILAKVVQGLYKEKWLQSMFFSQLFMTLSFEIYFGGVDHTIQNEPVTFVTVCNFKT